MREQYELLITYLLTIKTQRVSSETGRMPTNRRFIPM